MDTKELPLVAEIERLRAEVARLTAAQGKTATTMMARMVANRLDKIGHDGGLVGRTLEEAYACLYALAEQVDTLTAQRDTAEENALIVDGIACRMGADKDALTTEVSQLRGMVEAVSRLADAHPYGTVYAEHIHAAIAAPAASEPQATDSGARASDCPDCMVMPSAMCNGCVFDRVRDVRGVCHHACPCCPSCHGTGKEPAK